MLSDKPMVAMIQETNRALTHAVDHGLKDNLPPQEMVDKLKNDVFVFSACKTHVQLKEMSTLLVDDQGKIKSYQKFSQDVKQIHAQYNENYLQTEYGYAIGSAQMASKWVGFENDGERYNLQYRTAGDERVRSSHRVLEGTTLPLDDPFWGSYFPPNGWNCRCTTVQVRKQKFPESNSTDAQKKGIQATTQLDKNGVNRAEMFRFNAGKQKVIFPPNHPYYKVQKNIASIIDKLIPHSEFIDQRKTDPKTGHYEREIQDLFYRQGNKFILKDEKGFSKKHVDGSLNDKSVEIKTLLGDSHMTICRKIAESVDKGAEICILNFPVNNFSMKKLRLAFRDYNGKYPQIFVISKNKVVFKKQGGH
jgi:SPP1 gp7 family putative phage head morphogenesis protein